MTKIWRCKLARSSALNTAYGTGGIVRFPFSSSLAQQLCTFVVTCCVFAMFQWVSLAAILCLSDCAHNWPMFICQTSLKWRLIHDNQQPFFYRYSINLFTIDIFWPLSRLSRIWLRFGQDASSITRDNWPTLTAVVPASSTLLPPVGEWPGLISGTFRQLYHVIFCRSYLSKAGCYQQARVRSRGQSAKINKARRKITISDRDKNRPLRFGYFKASAANDSSRY